MRDAALWYLLITVTLLGLLMLVVALQALTGAVRTRVREGVTRGRGAHARGLTQSV